jgi:hypothetical protein
VLLFAAVAVPLLLRLVKLTRLRDWLEPASPPQLADPMQVEALVRRIDALLAAGRPLVRSGCLTRGLTLYRFLRLAGADVSLHFGMGKMGKTEEEIGGHCWLVFRGEPLAERRDPRPLYVETWRIAPAPLLQGTTDLP